MITQGFILIDEDGVALNNSGTVSIAGNLNSVATKKISKNGQQYTYVSGQAWRFWWRDTLQKHFGWNMSPITKLDKQNVLFTEVNPVLFEDDDVFGYMKAAKDNKLDDDGNTVMKKGKEEKENVTVTRISPLKNSVLISVGQVRVERNFSSASRQNDVPVLYGKEEYSAIMKGMFSIDLEQIGTFANYNKTGFKNISKQVAELLLSEKDTTTLDDKFVKNREGIPEKLIRLSKPKRIKRVSDTVKALKFISGGAMQTSNMGEVTPKFLVLATTTTGNHPFSHIVTSDPFNKEQTILNIEGLREVLNDYKDQFKGIIYIGKRNGFLNEYNEQLDALAKEFDGTTYTEKIKDGNGIEQEIQKEKLKIDFLSINQAIDKYCEQLNTLMS
jgi:CRISPR-associated protein Cst2